MSHVPALRHVKGRSEFS